MRNNKRRRGLSILLCAALLLSQVSVSTYAENGPEYMGGLCPHHTEHDEACGYAEGELCGHEHTDDCYKLVRSCVYIPDEDEVSGNKASPTDAERPEHECTEESGCMTKVLDCPHERGEHDAACGYAEASLCNCDCEICNPRDSGTSGQVDPKCDCSIPCAAGAMNEACPVCGAGDARPEDCGKYAAGKVIAAWSMNNTEYIKNGVLALPGASADNPATIEIIQPMLSTSITATVEDAAEPEVISLTDWICEDFPADGAWTGEYIFTASLPEGYALSDETAPLEVKVMLGGANELSEETGDFTVTGGEKEADYTYKNKTLTILKNTPITISMASGVAQTTSDHIVVQSGVTANITLENVDIQFRNGTIWDPGTCAFEVAGGAVCDLTLTGTNILKSGCSRAGLQVQDKDGAKATLAITTASTGSLEATGGNNGAGIGGGDNGAGGDITISGGTVTATGGECGAGIGGGNSGAGGNITINDGMVTATGGSYGGAGIGGGYSDAGGNITINGGTVTTTGNTYGGAGLGGGAYGAGGTITINNGAVTATGGGYGTDGGAGIGGGAQGAGGNITINDGALAATGGWNGAGIGGGSQGVGGNITINDGTVTATGGGWGAAIGGGFQGAGGDITITGGAIMATVGSYGGAGIGNGNDYSGTDTTFSTGKNGSACIVASSISDNSDEKKNSWNGIIFGGDTTSKDTGKIYGSNSYTISGEVTIPENKTLTIAANQTLTVGSEGTLNNSGTIIVAKNGKLDIAEGGALNNAGSLNGEGEKPNEGSFNDKKSTVTLDVSASSVPYGGTLTLTATVKEDTSVPTNARLRSFPQKTVIFYRGGTEIGRSTVSEINGVKTATITLNLLDWKAGEYKLTASYTGGDSQLLPSKSNEVALTVSKAEKTKPSAPEQSGSATATSIAVSTERGQKYLCTTDSNTPSSSSGSWQNGNGSTLTFNNLTPETTYYIWTYIPETDYYKASSVSPSLSVTTDKPADQKAVESAKTIIENVSSWTMSQTTANTEDNVKAELAKQIAALSGMSDTGVTVSAGNITITANSFTAATAGDADTPGGTNGSFGFTVSLSKGTTGNATTDSKTGTITATAFTGTTNAAAVATAKTLIEGGTYTMTQATANTESDVKTELARQINALTGMSNTGVTVTTDNITIAANSFTAAKAGTASDRAGENGSFSFTVSLTKGKATATTDSKTGTITATPYKAPVITTVFLPAGTVGAPYSVTFAATGDQPITWSISAGSLPDGLTLSGDTISGTPTTAGNFSVTVKAANGNTPDATKELTITISEKSADAALSGLSVEGATITPAFAPAITAYTASVNNSVSGVTITATANDSKAAVSGDIGGRTLSVGENTFTITVTAENGDTKSYRIVITRAKPSNSSSDSGSSGSGGSAAAQPSTPPAPNAPTTGEIGTGKPDKNGGVNVGAGTITDAISKAAQTAAQNHTDKNGVRVAVNLQDGTTSATLDRAGLDGLIAQGVKGFTLNYGGVAVTFDLPALQEIQRQSGGAVTFTAVKASGLTGDALTAIGTRPAYDLTISYTRDGKTETVSNLGAGGVSVALAYTPAKDELTGSLYAVYVKDGKAEWLTGSTYDPNARAVIFKTNHFSVFGIGYKVPPAFSDTAGHWAKTDIDFAASRGLFSGTSETTFTPDGAVTRGMFVTALGRLAGIDTAACSSSRFADIPATAYYAPYVAWAADKGIVNGTGGTAFSPDRSVTREEMAAIMKRYADRLGYTLPVAREAEIFADDGQISASFKTAVQAIQQAGIMNAKDGHRFGPKDAATRAEASAVLRRFVEAVIDPAGVSAL